MYCNSVYRNLLSRSYVCMYVSCIVTLCAHSFNESPSIKSNAYVYSYHIYIYIVYYNYGCQYVLVVLCCCWCCYIILLLHICIINTQRHNTHHTETHHTATHHSRTLHIYTHFTYIHTTYLQIHTHCGSRSRLISNLCKCSF